MAELKNYTIRPYKKGDNKFSFNCGESDLNYYFKSVLSQDIKRNQAAGYILWDDIGETVAGYFTISATHIALSAVPGEFSRKLPYNEVPFFLLGRLAIENNYKGKGLGEKLLMSVFELAYTLKQQIGAWGLAVDPINDAAVSFYSKFDFLGVKNDRRMFISMQTINKLF